MTAHPSVLAVIPARGGSKGLPGKNIRPFVGLPLIAHTIMFARMCPEITRCIVSTDSEDIAEVARKYNADVPFLRPPELAEDDTPIWPVLKHALASVEEAEGQSYDHLLLLDLTSPSREPADIAGAVARLEANPKADGIIGVSEPEFNPIWHCVIEKDGWMTNLIDSGTQYERRQDVPPVYRVNGSLYIWRTSFVRSEAQSWHDTEQHLMYEIPEFRAMAIDTPFEFERFELMVNNGLIDFPWLDKARK